MKIEQFMDKLIELVKNAEEIDNLFINAGIIGEGDDTVEMVECNIGRYIPKREYNYIEPVEDDSNKFDPDMLDKTANPGVEVVNLPWINPEPIITKVSTTTNPADIRVVPTGLEGINEEISIKADSNLEYKPDLYTSTTCKSHSNCSAIDNTTDGIAKHIQDNCVHASSNLDAITTSIPNEILVTSRK